MSPRVEALSFLGPCSHWGGRHSLEGCLGPRTRASCLHTQGSGGPGGDATPSTCCPQGSWCCWRSEGGLRAAGPMPVVGLGQGTRVGGRSPRHRVDGGGAGLTTHPGPQAPWGWPLHQPYKDGHGGGGVPQERWGRGVCRAPREELRPGVGSQVADQAKLHPPPGGCSTGREPSSKGTNSGGGWGLPWPQVPPPASRKRG